MDREIPDSQRRKRKRLKLIRICGVLVVAAVVVIALSSLMRTSVAMSDLKLATADVGTIDVTVTGSGTVSPACEEIITSPINSRIVEIYCKAGDSVSI
ncbi:MAG: efflux RND transporter periplasmic adaptor subunit, partial [Muribaculaceae bacterium]|nr:efflux RND transporter periplasmic adaptor subunit [Muribaculaceae bacterium]